MTKDRQTTIANACIDFVRAGFVLSPNSIDGINIIETPDGKPVTVILGDLDGPIVGEGYERVSRRISNQNRQAL